VPTLAELLGRSDIVSVHVPLTESSPSHRRGGTGLMKPTAVLINTVESVIDEDALSTP